jgi:hypothetical protein
LTPVDGLQFVGVLTGDLQGTASAAFDEIGPLTGVTRQVAGNLTFHITGGVVPELIGETFTTRIENRNVVPPGQTLVKNVGSLRAISGVNKANLTYVGQTSVDPFETRLEFTGVVCPG